MPNLFLGYFIHIVRREREGIFAKDLRECKAFFWGDVFVAVLVFLHFSKVLALNAQQAKFFVVMIWRGSLLILTPLFSLNGPPLLGGVPTDKLSVIWGPFLESPENFSGPKSHLWNCQPLVLESPSFNLFSRIQKKKKITVKFYELNALPSWVKKGIVTPENG